MDPKSNLDKLRLRLPNVSSPGGNYLSVNTRKDIAYVAIQFPILNDEYKYQGRLGGEITTDQGFEAMELCALNVLVQIDEKIGFESI